MILNVYRYPKIIGKTNDEYIEIERDEYGHGHHKEKTAQTVFEYEHRDVYSRRTAEHSGDEHAAVAYFVFTVAVFVRFFLRKHQ